MISARTDSDYGLNATVRGITQFVSLSASNQVMWGVPAAPVHDAERYLERRRISDGSAGQSSEQSRKSRSSRARRAARGPAHQHLHHGRLRPHRPHENRLRGRTPTGCDQLELQPLACRPSPRPRAPTPPRASTSASRCPQNESPDDAVRLGDQRRHGRPARGLLGQPERRRRQELLLRRRGALRDHRRSPVPRDLQGRHPLAAQLGPARCRSRARSTSATRSPATAIGSSSPLTASAPTSSCRARSIPIPRPVS